MKKLFRNSLFFTTFLVLSCSFVIAQSNPADSLKVLLENAGSKEKLRLLVDITEIYKDSSSELTLEYAEDAIELAQKLKNKSEEARAHYNLALAYNFEYNDQLALKNFIEALELKESIKEKKGIPQICNYIGLAYYYLEQQDSARMYYYKALDMSLDLKDYRQTANAYNNLGNMMLRTGNYDSALVFNEEALKLEEELEELIKVKLLNSIGSIYSAKGDHEKAITYFKQCAEINKGLSQQRVLGINYFNIGNSYLALGNYDEANDHYKLSLAIFEEIEFLQGIRSTYIGLALVYESWAQNRRSDSYPQAEMYYKKALGINAKLNDPRKDAEIYNNLGNLFGKLLGDYLESQLGIEWEGKVQNFDFSQTSLPDSAIYYYSMALKVNEEMNDQQGIAFSLNNIGTIYMYTGKFNMAKENYQKAFKANEAMGNEQEMVTNYRALGRVNIREGNYSQAKVYFEEALKLARKYNSKQYIQDCYEDLSSVYYQMGNYELALENYKMFSMTKDSIFSENSQKIISQLNAQLGAAEKEKEIEKQKAANQLSQERNKRLKFTIYLFIGVFVLISVLLLFIFRQNKVIRKTNDELAAKNHTIEEQRKEIVDSIHYASRIQRAILPPDEMVERVLPEKFILFKPRDIVSGDYYYITEKKGKVVVVAADCTGHGVPGAFMSMLGTAFLNEIMSQSEEIHSDVILNDLRSQVIKSLHQTGKAGESQDGMDLALYILDMENRKLEFSGANNPLVIIRDGEIMETKADKMPIGIHVRADEPFTRHDFDLQKGDVLYTFSDGFQDQFGGPKGKKFMIKNMKRMFTEIYTKPMEEQYTILNDAIEDWMSETDQIDDILVIGVRIV